MQKGFAPLFLIGVALIGVVSVYLYLFNKPTTTNIKSPIQKSDSLKTYTSNSFNFQFQYSKDLTVKDDSEQEFFKRAGGDFRKNFKGYVTYEPGKIIGAVVASDKTDSFDTNPFTIWVFDNPDNLNIDSWYDQYWYYPFVWGDFTYNGKFKTSPQNIATVSGQLIKSGVVDYQPGKPKFIYINYKGRMYLLRVINQEGNMGDQILQSFKLLD